jgi:hypothetical protein
VDELNRMTIRVALIVLLCAGTISAQTVVTSGPVTTDMRLAWDLPSNVTVADASTFEVRLRDGAFIPVTALTNVTCAGATCSAPVSASNADALNRVGVHSLTLSLFRADVGDSAPSTPFVLTSPAGAPVNPRLTKAGS